MEDISTGVHASGFGQVGDGRSFSFHIERQQLMIEIYRPRLSGPVPVEDDVVAVATRKLTDIDLTDERSLSATVRDRGRRRAAGFAHQSLTHRSQVVTVRSSS